MHHDWNARFNFLLCSQLETKGLKCFLPQRDVKAGSASAIFNQNKAAMDKAKIILCIVINESPNLGIEAGYAYGIKKKVIMLTSNNQVMPEMFEGMQVEVIRVQDLEHFGLYLEKILESLGK